MPGARDLKAEAYISPWSPQVIPFAADCDQDECTCRDPAAEENQ